MKRVNTICCAVVAGLFTAGSQAVQAQAFPTKPVRIVNPAAPGGNSEVFFRLLQPKMVEVLGQQLVMDYRPGAGGTIGGDAVAKSPADGYTTGLMAASFVINPAMIRKMPFDTLKDFTALGLIVDVPSGLVVHPSLPVKNLKDLIALSKKRPGEIFYSTSGRGTVGHLSGELLNSMANTKLVHVPYKGAGPALNDLMGGQIQFMLGSLTVAGPLVKANRLRGLGVTTLKRWPEFPDLPAVAETLPGYEAAVWYGLWGPKNLPKAVVTLWHREISRTLNLPELKTRWATEGVDAVGSTPEAFLQVIKSDIAKWTQVASQANLRIRGQGAD